MMMEGARANARAIFDAGLAAADPALALEKSFRVSEDGFRYGDNDAVFSRPDEGGRLRIFGAGKAAGSLTRAVIDRLDGLELSGRILVKYGHAVDVAPIEVHECGHPLPDENGVLATSRLLADLERGRASDRIVFVLTGGASSLLVKPASGISLADKILVTELLLRSGATIGELNAVRKHLSEVKGGRLLERMGGAPVLALVVSDVIGDDLSSIGSGPLVDDPTTFQDCLEIVSKYELEPRLPESVRSRLRAGAGGRVGETVKKGDPLLETARHVVLASNRTSLEAAREKAVELGFETEVFRRDMVGNVHAVAKEFVARLRSRPAGSRPFALLSGGELTLEVRGSGLGGRNQEFALVAARLLQKAEGIVVLSAGTDGTDGPTDAAGAFAASDTWDRARRAGIDPDAALANNDSYRVFDRLGDLLRTGPTGTNVNDLVVGLAG